MRKTALLVVLALSVMAAAQNSTAPANAPVEPTAQNRPAQPSPAPASQDHPLPPGVTPESLAAPQPGHPLNPNDVLILTGKDKDYQRPGYQPQIYYNYGMPYYGAPNPYFSPYGYRGSKIPLLSGGGILSGGSPMDSTPRFAPLLFGNAGGRPFFILGDFNQPNLRTPFLFPGGLVAPFTPVSPLFTFGNFVRPLPFGTRLGSPSQTRPPAPRTTTPLTRR